MTYTRPSETHQTFHPNGFVTFHTPTNTYMVIVKNIYMECLASQVDRWVECSRPVAMSYSHRRSTGCTTGWRGELVDHFASQGMPQEDWYQRVSAFSLWLSEDLFFVEITLFFVEP